MIGKKVSHYIITEELGRGGMGVVYKAEDTKLRRTVALKFLPPELTKDAEAKQRFLHEARAAAALNHTNIVTIHEINEHEGQVYIVMEYVEGRSLKEIISRDLTPSTLHLMPIPLALDIAIQIAKSLAAAHAKGIVHRDIKPANIFITNDHVVKILDFGIAKLAGSQTKLTKTGTTMGTAAYMSPEQTSGKEVDQRTDIWSLGVILYEMLSGETPFQGEYMQAVVYSILNEEPKPLGNVRSDMSPGLDLVVTKALAKDPKNRYQSMNDLATNLKAAAEGIQPIIARARGPRANKFIKKTLYLSVPAAALAILLALNIGGVRKFLFGPGMASFQAVRLAVLPFANLSGDPQQEYFSDGLTQEMISQLGKLHPQSLSVIARTSVMRYKKGDTPIDQIGRELGVDYVLEGSAQSEGGQVRVTAELIRVKNQAQLWADTYERKMSGILALQSDVAGKVAGALSLKLLPAEQARLANVPTVNPEAYDAYLKGSQLWPKMTKADVDMAQQYFELALAKDPNYALAYVGMAWVWIVRNQMGFVPPGEGMPKSKAAAQKAVELDPSLGEAHYALAAVRDQEWDWAGAELEWRQAIELCPNLSDARGFYSHYLMIMNRPEEAMPQIQRALELDPISTLVKIQYGLDLLYVHRYDDAIEQLRMALRAEPENPAILDNLWFALALKGRDKEAFATAKNYIKSVYGNSKVEEAFDRGFTQGGYKGGMRQAAEALAADLREAYASPVDIADLYIAAGETAQALNWLEKGFEIRDPTMPYLGLSWFDPLRSEPRFKDLLRRMGIPLGNIK